MAPTLPIHMTTPKSHSLGYYNSKRLLFVAAGFSEVGSDDNQGTSMTVTRN